MKKLDKKLHIILTCDGGSGHKSAAEALRTKAAANGDTSEVINTTRTGWFSGGGLDIGPEYDHMFYKGLIDLGPFATRWWDWAQRTSHTELLRVFASMRKISFLSIPSFRHRSYHLLKDREDINQYSDVIFHNTQPNCVQALVYSIAKYNREVKAYNQENPQKPQKNTVTLVNHFTDMPTLQAQMFIEEMAKIDVADLDDAQFELHTRPPIVKSSDPTLSSAETELRYHQRLKKLYPKLYQDLPTDRKRVKFVDGPIREAFAKRKETPAKRSDGLSIQFTNQAEFNAINHTLDDTLKPFDSETSSATMPLKEDTEIVSLMLGSQASIEGTLGLVQEEIESAKTSSTTKSIFVFCGANKPKEGLVLYQQVLDIANKVNKDPESRIKIIPLTNQPASMIADVYSLADRIITRPGGISIMEIEAVAKRAKIFIFTELGKIEKFFNKLLSRSPETLKKKFNQQKSKQRYEDLIAWEWGNALHARNACKDEQGRTRVVPVNLYTFQNELEFLEKKKAIYKLIAERNYVEAFQQLYTNAELNIFFLTGQDVGVDLAYLVEITQLYTQISNALSDLIEKDKELKTLANGPYATLALIQEMRDRISFKLKQGVMPDKILKDIPSQIKSIKSSLDNSLHVVRKSNIKNKHFILRTLEFLSLAISNFFRSMLGLELHFKPETGLENLNKDIMKVINRPVMRKLKPEDDNHVAPPSENSSNVDHQQWSEFDKIITEIIQNKPEQKNRTFIIKKSEHPQLKQDFLYCGASAKGEPACYAIGEILAQGGGGSVSLLHSRLGEQAIIKKHNIRTEIERRYFKSELECLKKMGMLIGDVDPSSDTISVQKYIPGKTLHNYLLKSHVSLFIHRKDIAEEKKIQLAIALLTELKKILDKGIVHGDIMPPNIIIQEHNMHQIKPTFVDFGLAHMEQQPTLNFVPYISPNYGAPELLDASRLHKNKKGEQVYPYSDKSDIYSLGIILRDIGIAPSITEQMTTKDPEQRPSVDEVLHTLSIELDILESNDDEDEPSIKHP